jgi:hypothetical protein
MPVVEPLLASTSHVLSSVIVGSGFGSGQSGEKEHIQTEDSR